MMLTLSYLVAMLSSTNKRSAEALLSRNKSRFNLDGRLEATIAVMAAVAGPTAGVPMHLLLNLSPPELQNDVCVSSRRVSCAQPDTLETHQRHVTFNVQSDSGICSRPHLQVGDQILHTSMTHIA